MLTFGDHLSNALHDIKQHTRKKISIVQDELGYSLTPMLTGDAIERWRYRKRPPTIEQVEAITKKIVAYRVEAHDRAWLLTFLGAADHPYPEQFADTLFPDEPDIDAPPLSVYRPPRMERFVGRTAEIAQYESQLNDASQGVAVISGMAGVGKTSLATMIAQKRSPVFWHTFRNGSADTLIMRLSGFVAALGAAELWQQLEASRLANVRPPSSATCIDALLAALDELDCLICLDDLQVAAEDGHVQRLVMGLLEMRPNLLITTRKVPRFLMRHHNPEPLAGLTVGDFGALAEARGVELSDDAQHGLHEHTAGHATFLTFGLVLVERGENVEALVGRLAQTDNVERFLLEEVDDYLSDDERAVMETIGIHRGQVVDEEALGVIADVGRVRRVVRGLCDQHLVEIERGDRDRDLYGVHGIVGDFYWGQMGVGARNGLHRVAAEHYTETDSLLAAEQWAWADDVEQVAQLVSEDAEAWARRGDGVRGLGVIERVSFDEIEKIDEDVLIGVEMGTAVCAIATGRFELARGVLERTAERLESRPDWVRERVIVCQRMGELLEREDVPEALKWVRRGLALVTTSRNKMPHERAILEAQYAILNMHIGNFGVAMELLDDLHHTDLPPHIQTVATYSRAGLHFYQNELSEAERLGRQALTMAEEQQFPLHKLRAMNNLGGILYEQGLWEEAAVMFDQGRKMARQLGDMRKYIDLTQNLAGVYVNRGRPQEALPLLLETVVQTNESKQTLSAMVSETWLVRTLIMLNEWDDALLHWKNAHQFAVANNDQQTLAMLDCFAADLALADERLADAEQYASAAVGRARGLGDRMNEGIYWRKVAEVAIVREQVDEVNKAFFTVLNLLPVHKYEYAKTQLIWGKWLTAQGEFEKAQTLLEDAVFVFKRMGAVNEVDAAEKLLSADVALT